MTLLLKSVWRNVLRGSSLSRSSVKSQSMSSCVSEVSRTKPPDMVMTGLKAAPSAADVLALVQTHLPMMTHKHMLQALRSLFELQKTGQQNAEELIKNPGFGVLCQNFKKHARALEVNEAIEAVKVLSFLNVPVESLIVQTMLQMIRCNINMISLRQIMFLDFLLTRFDTKNHLVDALKLALPLAFQIHLPLELDRQDLVLLKDMLAYSCSHDLPDRCINNVVTGLLLHDQAINAQIAKAIIWSLCQVNCTEEVYPTRVQLLHICYDILAQSLDQLTYDEVLKTSAIIKGRILEKHPEFYHEQLMDATAEYVINNDVGFERALLVARVLSRIAHTHLPLVEHLCQLAASSPDTLAVARTNILFGFVNCLANNNYTPPKDQWAELRRQISQNPVLDVKSATLPWTKFCLELASLGHYEDKLLARVFSEEFLSQYLSRANNSLDCLQLLTLHEAARTLHGWPPAPAPGAPPALAPALAPALDAQARAAVPTHPASAVLQEHLAAGLGSKDYVLRNIELPSGFVADLLMCLKGGYPLALPRIDSDSKTPIDKLNIPAGSVTVCIITFKQGCYSMNSNRLRGTFRLILDILEKQGYAAVAINLSEWLALPAHERTPYAVREVGYKCGEMGVRLWAT